MPKAVNVNETLDGLRKWANDLDRILADRAGRGLSAEPKTFDLQANLKLLRDTLTLLKPSTMMVAGERMELTLDEFQRRALVQIENLQADPSPDTWLIGLLCDAVRLARERPQW